MPPPMGNAWVRIQSRVSSSRAPAITTGRRKVPSSDIRVRWAPSEPSTRRVSSTISDRIVSGSRIAVTRAAISRSVRSVSARRLVSSRDRASSAISSALWIAIVARSASAPSRATSASPNRPGSAANTDSVPSTAASPTSGAKATDRMPAASRNARPAPSSVDALGGRVEVADHDPPLADRAEDALRARRPLLPARPGGVGQARVVRPADLSRGGVQEVDRRAGRPEQAGRLVDHPLEQGARLANGHHPPGDLAQGALLLGPPGERLP